MFNHPIVSLHPTIESTTLQKRIERNMCGTQSVLVSGSASKKKQFFVPRAYFVCVCDSLMVAKTKSKVAQDGRRCSSEVDTSSVLPRTNQNCVNQQLTPRTRSC